MKQWPLNMLAEKLGKVEIKPDKVEVAVEHESKYVAAGTKYKAEMFLAAGFSKSPATMTLMAQMQLFLMEGVKLNFLLLPVLMIKMVWLRKVGKL